MNLTKKVFIILKILITINNNNNNLTNKAVPINSNNN